MRKSLLEHAMSAEVLNRSWRRLRNEHTPWSPSVSRNQLEQNLLKYVLECRQQVLSGSYRPLSLRQFPMQKADGKTRIISAQYLQDKLVQRSLLVVLEPKAEAIFHNDSYGYRPKRSVAIAMNKVRERVKIGQYWLVDADIQKFFDSIPHKPLIVLMKTFIQDTKTMQLIKQWLKQGAHHSSLLNTRRGISQGSVLSPLFCNLYLNEFDQALASANIPFVRFADDFLLFSESEQKAQKSMLFAKKQLDRLGLILHSGKTRVVRSSPRVIFLGEKLPQSL